jgi:hypothetical protein
VRASLASGNVRALAVALVLAGLTACGPAAVDRRPRTTSPDPSPPTVLTIPMSETRPKLHKGFFVVAGIADSRAEAQAKLDRIKVCRPDISGAIRQVR